MSAEQRNWRFDKVPADFRLYDDFDDGDYSGWTTENCAMSQLHRLNGTGYSVELGADGLMIGRLTKDTLAWSAYDDLHLVITFYVPNPLVDMFVIDIRDQLPSSLFYSFGTAPSDGDINITIQAGVWYTFVLPISDDFFTRRGTVLDLDSIEFQSRNQADAKCYVFWVGIFRESGFSDDYCRGCICGLANNVDSGVRDCDMDDCYLKTTNSDITITEDVVVDSNNAKLTIYGTLGEGMRCRVTISWEISSVPQTDKVLYADVLPYAFDLDIECPSIDMVTKIIIENILAP